MRSSQIVFVEDGVERNHFIHSNLGVSAIDPTIRPEQGVPIAALKLLRATTMMNHCAVVTLDQSLMYYFQRMGFDFFSILKSGSFLIVPGNVFHLAPGETLSDLLEYDKPNERLKLKLRISL